MTRRIINLGVGRRETVVDPSTVREDRPVADPAAMAQRLRLPGQARPTDAELLELDAQRNWGRVA